MSWVKAAVSALSQGREVDVRPQGGSMRGRIENGQRVTLVPIEPEHVQVDDVVFVEWKGSYLLHLVIELTETDALIGNNVGKVNGWVTRSAILGRVIAIHAEDHGSHPAG